MARSRMVYRCTDCGVLLDDAATPCANCGGTLRRQLVTVEISPATVVGIEASAREPKIVTGTASGTATTSGAAKGSVTTPVADQERKAEYHLTVLADRTDDGGGLIVRIIDENAADPDATCVVLTEPIPKDDLAIQIGIDLSELLDGA